MVSVHEVKNEDVLYISEPETEPSEERYNISDVGTVFQLAQVFCKAN